MFKRFTERARQVVVLAQEEARALEHNHIGTEHLLLGLLREKEGLAARVLERLDITIERVRAAVVLAGSSDEEVTSGHMPFTPRAKRILELALREALSLGHHFIATDHILLALARENDSVAARILLDADADYEKIRNELIRMLSGPGARQDDPAHPSLTRDLQVPDLGGMSDSEIDNLMDALLDQERAIAYRRRVIHGNLDILRAERAYRRTRDLTSDP